MSQREKERETEREEEEEEEMSKKKTVLIKIKGLRYQPFLCHFGYKLTKCLRQYSILKLLFLYVHSSPKTRLSGQLCL